MVHFKLNGKDACVQEKTTIRKMLILFGFEKQSEEDDEVLLITEGNRVIQKSIDEVLIKEGHDIGVMPIPAGG